MTDLNTLPEKIPERSRSSCLMKKLLLAFIVLIVLLALLVACYFCLYIYPKSSASTQELGQLQRDIVSLNAKVEDLTKRVNSLEAKTDNENSSSPGQRTPLSPAPTLTNIQNDLATLSSTVSILQNEVKRNTSHALHAEQNTSASLAAAIAFIQLREGAMSGHGFSRELKNMENAAKNDGGFQESLNQLEPLAEKGAPTIAELHEQLLSLEAPISQALDRNEAATWWDRLLAELRSLVSIRHIKGDGGRDIFSPLETNIAKGDIEAALDSMPMLPPEARNNLSDWREAALARQKINQALAAIADHFTALTNNVPAEREP